MLAILLAIISAVGVLVVKLMEAPGQERPVGVFLLADVPALVEVTWTTLLGAASMRTADALPESVLR